VTGKEASDIATRKKTLPLIYALEQATGSDAERLRSILAQSGTLASAAAVDEARLILERVGAHDYAREQARRHRDEALAEITAVRLVDREAIERLTQIVRATISA
jgi:geranylgeranyl pyrophosphate synthase